MIETADYVARWPSCPFSRPDRSPWQLPPQLGGLILQLLSSLGPDFRITDDHAIHRSATIEAGAMLKGPAIIGSGCFVAAGAYLRGGVYLQQDVTVGPGAEIKSSVLFAGARIAHFNFVGDSIVGADVNLEAGAVIANYRNEAAEQPIRIRLGDEIIDTGVPKFGAIVGDGARIGANAVIAPGAVLKPGQVVPRLALIDQSPLAGA